MKQVFTFLAAVLLTVSVFAQSPEKMSYQAVIRDASNNLITDTQVGMQISILQGSASGTAVYVETQTPTTNVNGLVSLEIGTGTTSDVFSAIDWANGPYFIKTETDPAGGTSYTITGTSQLLSVPYALHAKSAETATNYTETDPISVHLTGNQSITGNKTFTDPMEISGTNLHIYPVDYDEAIWVESHPTVAPAARTWLVNSAYYGDPGLANLGEGRLDGGLSIFDPAMGYAATFGGVKDGGGTQHLIGGLGVVTSAYKAAVSGISTDGLNYAGYFMGDVKVSHDLQVDGTIYGDGSGLTGVGTYSVGDFAQGGIVFWVDETGQHGLVCAKTDQDGGSGIRWYAGTYGVTRATGDGPFSGKLNTAIIISSQVSIGDDGSDYAAQICNDLQITEGGKTYGDWYLPSKKELTLMYQNKATIDATAVANGGSGFASAFYWSSTEYNSNNAWVYDFHYGNSSYSSKNGTYRVRAVRAF